MDLYGCLLRHQRKYAPTRRAINNNGIITAMAITPPLILYLLETAAVGVAVELEDAVEVEIDVETDVKIVKVLRAGEEVVVTDVDTGPNLTLVNTACSFKPAG